MKSIREEPGAETVRAQVEKISTSLRFVNAHKLTHFLRLIVEESLEGRGDQIKEYTIGVEVYSRRQGYDPRVDSTVRVEATKLRKRLSEYYAGEGRNDLVLITIPKGRYAPVFEYRPSEKPPGGPPFRWRLPLSACVALAILAGGWWMLASRQSFRLAAQRRISTFPGSHTSASFSPDGAMIAFVARTDRGTAQVWVKNLSQGDPLRITDGDADAARPRWSPKKDQIVFERKGLGIWSAPPLGGSVRRIIEEGRNPDFSPDGGRLVFQRGHEIWTARTDGTAQQPLPGLPWKVQATDSAPVFSPDGQWIAVFHAEVGPKGDLWVLPTSRGQPRRLTFDVQEGGDPAWTPDGRWIVFPSARSGSLTLWRVASGGGAPEPLTTGAGEDLAPAISPDGQSLIFTNTRNNWGLTLLDPASGARTEVLSQREDIVMPAFSPAGDRIAFFQHMGGDVHLFVVRADGTELRQVTRDRGHQNIMPAWSEDGNSLYFYQVRPDASFRKVAISGAASVEVAPWVWGKQNFARMDSGERAAVYTLSDGVRPKATVVRDIATGREKQLAEAIARPQWSRDGTTILGSTDDDRIMVCPSSGGACKVLTTGKRPKWSGDGSRIYFFRAAQTRDSFELWSSADDGSEEKRIAQLGPFRPAEAHFDVSSRGQIVWAPFREGRQELWLAEIR
jgi:Tol biopolymer transport system component